MGLTRLDPQVDFDWPGSPSLEVAPDNFSVRWTGQLEAPISGPLTIYLLATDTGRIWLDGVLLMGSWLEPRDPQEVAATVDALAGQKFDLRVELRERTGSSQARQFWSWPCQAREVIPTTQLYPAPVS